MAACLLAPDQPDLFEGQFVGQYRITSLLGVGGMGEVYLAEDTKLGRKIALKLLPADFTKDVDDKDFRCEADLYLIRSRLCASPAEAGSFPAARACSSTSNCIISSRRSNSRLSFLGL